ncbi:ABC transporter substrate-binding protein [bacterium]|nr:MAG: ABC transporter substrate-binding protein [bacterium]
MWRQAIAPVAATVRRRLSVVVTVAAILFLGASVGSQAQNSGPIKIGLAGGLTGSQSFLGQAQREGVVLAADQLNASGGINGRKIDIISEDDQFDPSRAAAIAQRFISQDRVDAIIAGTNTGTALVYAKACEAAKVPLIVSFASDDRITQGKQWSFAVDTGVKEDMQAIVAFASQHFKHAALTYDDDAYGQAARDYTLAELKLTSIAPSVVVAMPDGGLDYGPQIARLQSAAADVVLAGNGGSNVAQMAKNMVQVGYQPLVLGPASLAFTSMIEIGGTAVEHKVWFTDTIDNSNPKFVTFAKAFEARYHETPQTGFELLAYDSMEILAKAIQQAGGVDKNAVQATLDNIHYAGVSGKAGTDISFPAATHRRPGAGITWRWVNKGKFANVPPSMLANPAALAGKR